ncbi:hypothetical protein G6F68_013594 [Rhizopus microsporus]|nr:hypothetical protein G6F68_013594 [Rhizopus microsporus]
MVEHADVVPDWSEPAVLGQRCVEERACAHQVTFGKVLGAAVVVEMRQGPRTADRNRPAPVVEHVAVEVDGTETPADVDAGVDVPDVVDHAVLLVLVPRHHLSHFLHAGLDAGFAGKRHEQQGPGRAGRRSFPPAPAGAGRGSSCAGSPVSAASRAGPPEWRTLPPALARAGPTR